MDTQNSDMSRNQLLVGAIILVLIAGAFGFWLGRTVEPPPVPGKGIQTEAGLKPGVDVSGIVIPGLNAIAVSDQPPGMMVAIAMLTLAQDGWVVIHEDRNGAPGNILGAQRFNVGQGQSGQVELLRATEEGRVYYAMLHADDGDRVFDHTNDMPITDQQGNVILMRFVATADVEGL